MDTSRRRVMRTAMAVAMGSAVGARAQVAYPARPVRLVLPYSPGGSGDVVANTLIGRLSDRIGNSVFLDHKPGAGGNLGTGLVAKAPPDGHTLLLATDIQMAINPHVYKDLGFDRERDFAPVIMAAFVEFVLCVHPSLPVNTLEEFIAYARSRPRELSYASAGIGSTHHLSMELLKQQARVDLVHIPYKGSGQIIPDLIAGRVQAAYMGIPQSIGQIKAGRVKALGVGSPRRLPSLPQVAPLAESGLPGFEANSLWSIFAPAGTPAAIVGRLNVEIGRILGLQEVSEFLVGQGLSPVGGRPEALSARMRSDYEKWGEVIRASGVRLLE